MESYVKLYKLEQNNIADAGTVSSLTKRALKKRNLHPDFIKKVIIGVYEAEINVVIHSYGGNAVIVINDQYIEVLFKDIGPGIESIENAMKEGFSTASSIAIENGFGAGMGLPNIKAVSDEMTLESSKEGTTLALKFYIKEDSYAN